MPLFLLLLKIIYYIIFNLVRFKEILIILFERYVSVKIK